MYDVVVVGCGMLGNISALILSKFGFRVCIIEKKKLNEILLPKSSRIDDEVMMIFENLGLLGKLNEYLQAVDGLKINDHSANTLLKFSYSNNSNFSPIYTFYQPDVQYLLQNELKKDLNITTIEGYEVDAYEKKGHIYDIILHKNNEYKNITSKYILVCNGQFSKVSKFTDINVRNYNYKSSVLCVDCIKNTDAIDDFARIIYNSKYPVTFFSCKHAKRRFEFQIDDTLFHNQNIADQVRALMGEITESESEIDNVYIYNFETKILDEWHKNSVFIAGDAAHIMPPFLGMGLSSGIKDVYNLVWKLKLFNEKKVDSSIFDSYRLERINNIRHLINLNFWIKRLFKSSKLKWIKFFVPIIPKSFLKRNLNTQNYIKQGLIANKFKFSGTHIFSDVLMDVNKKEITLNRIIDTQFVIIGLDVNAVDNLSPNNIGLLAQINCKPIKIITKGQYFVDDGRFTKNYFDFKNHYGSRSKYKNIKYIIVRPDRMIYGACESEISLNGLFEHFVKNISFKFDYSSRYNDRLS